MVTDKPVLVSGSPLRADGKPEVLYVGYEYCPYCATQNWALIVALGRFGTFTGLSTIRSASYRPYPRLDTWTFYGSSYTSRYLTFVPVEEKSNVLTSRTANPQSPSSYTTLQKLSGAEQAVMKRYDTPRSVPFTDFGNRSVLAGSSFDPLFLEQQTWSQIAAICQLTDDQPARVCTPAIRRLDPRGGGGLGGAQGAEQVGAGQGGAV